MKVGERGKKEKEKEVQWDLIDRCLLPLIFSHAAAVIITTFLNTLNISQISFFSVFFILVFFTLLITLSFHNLKVSYAGKCIVLSGCENHIGYSIAKYLDDLGFTVYAGFNGNEKQKQKLKNECSGRLNTLDLDISSEESITVVLKNVQQLQTGVWAVVNAASWSAFGESEWVPTSVLKKTIDVNLLGAIALSRSFLPVLRKTKGRIINITSIAGRIRSGIRSPLCIVSSGLQSFSDCLRLNMKRWGVDVVLIETGMTTTGAWYERNDMLNEARKLWHSLNGDQREVYNEKYFECKITSMNEYSNDQEDLSMLLKAVGDAVTRTFPLARYTPVTRKEKLQAFVAEHLPHSVYSIMYE
ncbi:D-beta-hydroxybutyrate dehydrogenase, mitochondrial [Rhodnius prolixus]|uniref:Uncharacterized protein n=2 Tax=Rhodnius prolixus TaxID=13249 RepID=T1HIH0_RHOPR